MVTVGDVLDVERWPGLVECPDIGAAKSCRLSYPHSGTTVRSALPRYRTYWTEGLLPRFDQERG